ncbi:hypothetical protein B0H14DRAFT_2834386 [Mycena olivaceomarginata]|nr:hypothetical protein B0H14DRAFT_2834386 [Mycena olivaceomarginata]
MSASLALAFLSSVLHACDESTSNFEPSKSWALPPSIANVGVLETTVKSPVALMFACDWIITRFCKSMTFLTRFVILVDLDKSTCVFRKQVVQKELDSKIKLSLGVDIREFIVNIRAQIIEIFAQIIESFYGLHPALLDFEKEIKTNAPDVHCIQHLGAGVQRACSSRWGYALRERRVQVRSGTVLTLVTDSLGLDGRVRRS